MNIKDIRESKNITQGHIANQLNLARSSYALKENGMREFKPVEYVKLSKIFGIDLEALILENTKH